jgi:mono/diheme cytochrome c family protein
MVRFLLPFLAAGLLGCSPATSAPPAPSPEASPPAPAPAPEAEASPSPPADRGATVFAQHCASCHGATGRGDGPAGQALDPPAADLVGPRAEHLRGIPRRSIIEEGRPGTAMVGWKAILSAEDLEAVYGFVHDLKHKDGGPRGRGRGHGGGQGRHGG